MVLVSDTVGEALKVLLPESSMCLQTTANVSTRLRCGAGLRTYITNCYAMFTMQSVR